MHLLFFPTNASAKARNVYLTDFILENKVGNAGFHDALPDTSVSYDATNYALEMLKFYDKFECNCWFGEYGKWWGDVHYFVNSTGLAKNLGANIETILDGSSKNLNSLYHLLKALKVLEELNDTISLNIKGEIINYINGLEYSGGFGFSGNTSFPNAISTYFAIEILTLIEEDINDPEDHLVWIKSCQNADGGFGETPNTDSSLIGTYYSILILNRLGSIDEDLTNPSNTLNFIKSFLIETSSDTKNFGGFLPDQEAKYALLSSTSYGIEAISLINENYLTAEEKSNIITWILNRQNVNDGGFVDNSDGAETKDSSITISYYAFRALGFLDPNLTRMQEDVWMVDFNYIVLIIVLASIGAVIALMVFIYQRRKI